MNWVIAVSAVLMTVALFVATRYLRRRGPALESNTDPENESDPRLEQFRFTGSHRLAEPTSAPTDLRQNAQAKLEEADLATDLAMLDAFLADVRDSIGGDEAVFWRWSEHRDALKPASWSTSGTKRPMHFDVSAWGALLQWSAKERVISFDADARVALQCV